MGWDIFLSYHKHFEQRSQRALETLSDIKELSSMDINIPLEL